MVKVGDGDAVAIANTQAVRGFPGSARVLCGPSSFLPQSEDKHTGQIGKSKLFAGVNVRENGCLSFYVVL